MRRYAFIHVEYGRKSRDPSIQLLARFRQVLVPSGNQVSLVIVDNAMSSGEERYTGHGFDDIRVIAGDNANREFSAWDAGVKDVLSRSSEEPDVWFFTNDTVATHHGWSKQRVNRFCTEAEWLSAHAGPWMLGEVTNCAKPEQTPLGPIIQWVSTYAFAMNGNLRQGLGTLCPGAELLDSIVHDSYEPAHKLLRDDFPNDYFAGALVWLVADQQQANERARKYAWSHPWHNASTLNAETFPSLRGKARCVLSETFLTQRARKLGADLWSPYTATTGRDRLRRTAQYMIDKMSEKAILRRQRKASAG
jgi:hypothetical protein